MKESKSNKKRKIIIKALGTALAMPIFIVLTATTLLYIPSIQKYAINKCSELIARHTNYNLYMEKFNLHFPFHISIGNFTLSEASDTLLNGDRLRIDINILPLIKGEIEANYISIDNTIIDTHNLIDDTRISGTIGHFRTAIRNADLYKEHITINQLNLTDSKINLEFTKSDEPQDTAISQPSSWIISLNKGKVANSYLDIKLPQDTTAISTYIGSTDIRKFVADLQENDYRLEKFMLDNSRIKYDKGTLPDSISPIDHLHFGNIAIDLQSAQYSPENVKAEIKRFAMQQEPSGIAIEKCNMSVTGDSSIVSIKGLNIASSNGTTINADATLPLLLKNGNSANIKTKLHINKRDIKGFITKEKYESLKMLPDSLLNLEAQIHGNTKKTIIDTINVNIPHFIQIGITGKGTNLANNKKRAFELHYSGKAEDKYNIQDTTHTGTITKQLNISGQASLIDNNYTINTSISTAGGTATAEGTYKATDNTYKANIETSGLNISKLLPHIPLHKLNMKLELSGCGTDIYSNATQYNCKVQIDSVQYDNYTYNNIILNAQQDNSTSKIRIKSESEQLQMELTADTKIEKKKINNSTKIDILNADIQKLGLSERPITVCMKLETDIISNLKEKYFIKAKSEDVTIYHKGKKYTPEKLHITSSSKKDSTMLHLTTGDLTINAYTSSNYIQLIEKINKIKTIAEKSIQSHDTLFDIKKYESIIPETSIKINSKSNNILANYLSINGIKYDAVNLACLLDSQEGINARGHVLNLEHNNQHLDTIRFAISQDSTKLKYYTRVKSRAVLDNAEKSTFTASLFGTLNNNTLTANYIFRDRNDATGIKLGASATILNDGYLIRFAPTAILFKQPFTFNKENEIHINREMKIRGNIEMRDTANSGLSLHAQTDSTHGQDITLELYNIDLQTVTKILPFAPDIAGTLNIDMHYNQNNKNILFGSDVSATNLAYEGTLIGNERIELSYFPKSNKEHSAYLTMQHNDSEVAHFEGTLDNDTINNSAKGELSLNRFPLKIANAFLKETGVTSSGYIEGNLNINTKESTSVDGYLRFDSAYADVPNLGSTLHLVDDKIDVENNIIKFQNFDIYAKGNTPFNVNGTIDMNTPLNPDFNLRMRANDYEIVNSKRTKSSILYGRMFINLNSRITGHLNTLKVDGSATVLGKSDITYVIQDTPLESGNNLDGLITFTNFKDTTNIETDIPEYNLGDINMNITLAIEEGARINADFDKERNSYIELQGEGNLNLNYTGETGMNLTGRYLLSNGQMKYTLPIIPLKTFNIKQGSYINWSGDIMNPTLSITAVERMITSVIIDENSQAVQFDVGIKLTNNLNNIGLSFTLSSPENAAVQNQLNALDAETLNKYAITMLITGAYIGGENNLSVSSALSSFLDTQVNNLVGNVMSNTVDINVGITDLEDATTGDTYKNYSFSFTKRFWNDRLKVIIGGEVNNNTNAPANESFINNVSLEWKISNSGNRYLRLFYDKNYESILEGEIIETGVGYVYKRKLNNLNELLIFKKKDKKPAQLPQQLQNISRNDKSKQIKEQKQ